MKKIELDEYSVGANLTPDGTRLLFIAARDGSEVFFVPLDQDTANSLAASLTGVVIPAWPDMSKRDTRG